MQKTVIVLFFLAIVAAHSQNKRSEVEFFSTKVSQHFYRNKDSTSYFLQKLGEFYSKDENWASLMEVKINEIRNLSYFYDINGVKTNIEYMDSLMLAQKTYLDSLPNRLLFINSLNYDKGNYYFKISNFKEAKAYFQGIIVSLGNLRGEELSKEDKALLSGSNSFLAKILTEEGKHEQAIQLYLQIVRSLQKDSMANSRNLNTNYGLLAEAYRRQNKLDLANSYFLKSLAFSLREGNGSNNIISVSENLVQNFIDLGELKKASYYTQLIDENLPKEHNLTFIAFRTKAALDQASGDYTSALKNLQLSLQAIKNSWDTEQHDLVAHTYNRIGLLHLHFNKPQEAIQAFDRALHETAQYSGDAKKKDVLGFLKNKNLALKHLNSVLALADMLKNVDKGVGIFNELRPRLNNPTDKQLLTEELFPLLESGIEAAFQEYEQKKDPNYLHLAFSYAEKSKSILLLEALLGSAAFSFAHVPDSLVQREQQLRSELVFFEERTALATKKTDSKTADKLFYLRQSYNQLVQKIEKDYPKYYELKYGTDNISLTQVQEALSEHEQLLAYFYGQEAIYAFGIYRNGIKLEKIARTETLEQIIRKTHEWLGDPKSSLEVLSESTHGLYQQLVEPVLFEKSAHLTIVPDGLLNYIPFGALNTRASGWQYLIEKHAISYANSVTLLQQLEGGIEKNHSVLAFAPLFVGQGPTNPLASRGSLLPLPHNTKEVEAVMTSFGGRALSGSSASLQNFMEQQTDYGILHFATHAVFNDKLPEYSYLAFSEQQDTDQQLYVNDLYGLQIDKDMVTLSACETGIGELKRGEGFLSLARGFFYSGAKSITSTLWSVNDASSATVMDYFYQNLAKGEDKAMALQRAQIKFLEQHQDNTLRHPYYWSGFVVSGSTTPLVEKKDWMLWLLGSIVLVPLVVLGRRHMRKASA